MVKTIDTDVLILLLSFVFYSNMLPNSKVYASMDKTDVEFYNVIDIATELGNDTRNALPFFYAFSGCDSVSSIFSKGKCKIWDVWQTDEKCRDITSVFIDLGNFPDTVNDYQIEILEYFLKRCKEAK